MSTTVRTRRTGGSRSGGRSARGASRTGGRGGSRRGRRSLVIGGTLLVAGLGAFLLLNSGREHLALPYLHELDRLDCAEAVFYLGVLASQRIDYGAALTYMRRAHELDPFHEDTLGQISTLETLLSETA